MHERDVPQEGNATLAGHRKAVYAVGEDGKLRIVASRGWQVEEIVTRQALAELEERAREARPRPHTAGAGGRGGGRGHVKPWVFPRLPLALKRRYVEALGIAPDALE